MTLGGEGRGRGRGLAVAALAVLALVVAGLLLGGGDDGEQAGDRSTTSSTRARRPRPSTTTTMYVPAPVLPEPTGGYALVVINGRRWVHLDLDTGARTEVEARVSDSYAYPFLAVSGGVVVGDSTRVRYLPVPDGEPVVLSDDGGSAHPGATPDQVWVETGGPFVAEDTGEPMVRLVAVHDGEVLAGPFSLGDGAVVGSTEGGLVVSAGARLFLVGADGGRNLLPEGDFLGSSGRFVALRTCDDQIRCRAVLHDVTTDEAREIEAPEVMSGYRGWFVVVSDEGHLAIQEYGPEERMVIRLADGTTFDLPGALSGGPQWLPGGQGLVIGRPQGPGNLRHLSFAGGRVEEREITALARYSPDFLLVIPP